MTKTNNRPCKHCKQLKNRLKTATGSALALLLACAFMPAIAGCSNEQADAPQAAANPFQSFYDVPGITDGEIADIEALQARATPQTPLIYASSHSTELFENKDGTLSGYTVLFCDWLSELIGIPIQVEMHGITALNDGLGNGTIDLATIIATPERVAAYSMSGPIVQRIFVKYRYESSQPLSEISKERLPRYAFIEESTTIQLVADTLGPETYEEVMVADEEGLYLALKNGEADAFVLSQPFEALFDQYEGIYTEDFLPLSFLDASVAAANPDYDAVISVITKALQNGAAEYLADLHRQGNHEYRRHKFSLLLSDEEREYMEKNPVLPFATQYASYPISFYNENERKWDGIVFDILEEMRQLTDLDFEMAHDEMLELPDLMALLESGAALFMPNLIQTPERAARFDFLETYYLSDRYALLSKQSYPDVELNDVMSQRVGVIRGTAFAETFRNWFPNALYVTEYPTADDAFMALDSGEIDLLMSIQTRLITMTNYYELSDYKANYLFSDGMEITFAVNKNHAALHSIFEKALSVVETERTVDQWLTKTYDYQMRVFAAQRPWLIGAVVLALLVIALVLIILFRSRDASAKLRESMERTLREQEAYIEEARRADIAEMSNAAKSIFLANMSHEIRTPMNAILGITEIELQNERIAPDTKESLDKIYDSGNLLLNIINDILDLSKIEAGKLEIVQAKYNVPSLINDAVQINRIRYESKPIEFFLDIDENTPLNLLGDEMRIKQVLNNILSNAYKYTEKGSVRLSVSAEEGDGDMDGNSVIAGPEPQSPDENDINIVIAGPEPQSPDDSDVTLVLQVSDTGQGMTEEQLSMLFLEYTRFNSELNKTTTGTGLGLSITKRLLELMGGEIDVESRPGKGSVFTVRIPQKRADGLACGADLTEKIRNFRFQGVKMSKSSRIMREHMPYGRVLVVDDVEINIYVAKGMLLPYGLRVDSATSGPAAIEKIKAGNVYDIIFMDHMMPGMDGIETVKILRGMGYKHCIIALTANAMVGYAEIFLENGFDAYISKPIDTRELDLKLNEFVRNKKSPKAAEAARRERRGKKKRGDEVSSAASNKRDMEKLFALDAAAAIGVLETSPLMSGGGGAISLMSGDGGAVSLMSGGGGAASDADKETYEITVHGMKSALLSIGETELSDFALELEKAALENNLDLIRAETPAFVDALGALAERMKSGAGTDVGSADGGEAGAGDVAVGVGEAGAALGSEVAEADLEYLRGKLSEVKTACEASDEKTSQAIMDDLMQKPWPNNIDDILDEINVHLLHGAFAKAAQAAESWEHTSLRA